MPHSTWSEVGRTRTMGLHQNIVLNLITWNAPLYIFWKTFKLCLPQTWCLFCFFFPEKKLSKEHTCNTSFQENFSWDVVAVTTALELWVAVVTFLVMHLGIFLAGPKMVFSGKSPLRWRAQLQNKWQSRPFVCFLKELGEKLLLLFFASCFTYRLTDPWNGHGFYGCCSDRVCCSKQSTRLRSGSNVQGLLGVDEVHVPRCILSCGIRGGPVELDDIIVDLLAVHFIIKPFYCCWDWIW